jgi:uncharacterized membrane protein
VKLVFWVAVAVKIMLIARHVCKVISFNQQTVHVLYAIQVVYHAQAHQPIVVLVKMAKL